MADRFLLGLRLTTKVKLPSSVSLYNDTSFIVNGDILELNSEFNWKNYVSASDSQGSDLIGYVIMNGNVDTSIAGKYEVEFILNWNGESISKKVDFFVNE